MAQAFRRPVATTLVMLDGEDPNIKEAQYEGREGDVEGGGWKVQSDAGVCPDRRARYQPTYTKSYVSRLEETLPSEQEKGKD